MAAKALACAEALEHTYGRIEPPREEPLDVLVWTVLSQNTSDRNSERAFRRLKDRFPTWEQAARAAESAIADAIRPGGLAEVKARYIKEILARVRDDSLAAGQRRMGLDYLDGKSRQEVESYLVALPGVGPKTAACVTLFGFGMPSLPVDTHVLRLARRLGFVDAKAGATSAQRRLEAVVPEELQGRLHLGLIAHGRSVCRPARPRCHVCPIGWLCSAQPSEGGNSLVRTGKTGSPWTYDEAVDYLEGLARFGSRPGLSRTRRLLAALGNPERGMRIVHVAGTNGKGSVCALLESIARAQGLVTGLYTSPHLTDFTERIRMSGTVLAKEAFAAAAWRAARECPGLPEHPTQFEVLTAMAFDVMREAGVDLAIVEVGLGGRYDATNVVTPLISVIASISLDHTEVLGGSLGSIARDKAGIIKPRVPVVAAYDEPPADGGEDDAAAQIAAAADAKGAPLTWVLAESGAGGHVSGSSALAGRGVVRFRREQVLVRAGVPSGQIVSVEGPGWRLEGLSARLFGLHQAENCAVAVAAVRSAFPGWADGAIREGVASARWDGRFEVARAGRTVVVLDGAHNAEGAQALRRALDDAFPGSTPVVIVLGLSKDKPAASMVRDLCGRAALVVATRAAKSRMGALEPQEIARLVHGVHGVHGAPGAPETAETAETAGVPSVIVEPRVADAVREALSRAAELAAEASCKAPPVVCVCGSLYVVGEARQAIAREGLAVFEGGV